MWCDRPEEVAGIWRTHVEGIGDVAGGIAKRFRKRPGFDASTVITREDLQTNLTLVNFVTWQATEAPRKGMNKEDAAAHGDLIGAHLEYMCNFELHRRKTFWVDEALAWMVHKIQLELTGDPSRVRSHQPRQWKRNHEKTVRVAQRSGRGPAPWLREHPVGHQRRHSALRRP